jgi:hypothetical protein
MHRRTFALGAAAIASIAGASLWLSQPGEAQVLKQCVYIAVNQRTGHKLGTFSARGVMMRMACRRARRMCNNSIRRHPASLRVRCRRAS